MSKKERKSGKNSKKNRLRFTEIAAEGVVLTDGQRGAKRRTMKYEEYIYHRNKKKIYESREMETYDVYYCKHNRSPNCSCGCRGQIKMIEGNENHGDRFFIADTPHNCGTCSQNEELQAQVEDHHVHQNLHENLPDPDQSEFDYLFTDILNIENYEDHFEDIFLGYSEATTTTPTDKKRKRNHSGRDEGEGQSENYERNAKRRKLNEDSIEEEMEEDDTSGIPVLDEIEVDRYLCLMGGEDFMEDEEF